MGWEPPKRGPSVRRMVGRARGRLVGREAAVGRERGGGRKGERRGRENHHSVVVGWSVGRSGALLCRRAAAVRPSPCEKTREFRWQFT